ncbi:hypothetical protein SARC_06279 [Sphaeroforma arctica JP610]|uniref:Uncharacterized protein n=1 Tax=Sphaeroforma arctica JP610 TaxID=667725 RepID=A0A0L0FX33_9EUKA|nr:hypothetical protein SARC_06279 [Sphaeroforma arctica JP610]KNC81392.1 hypothetical protein SARC_06279 [Sphaeroforma arctica JP610]|eukprot:XP_014155294.1 hypothetical protein SARC_06279 [Sphaeroforma arctica JP610]
MSSNTNANMGPANDSNPWKNTGRALLPENRWCMAVPRSAEAYKTDGVLEEDAEPVTNVTRGATGANRSRSGKKQSWRRCISAYKVEDDARTGGDDDVETLEP